MAHRPAPLARIRTAARIGALVALALLAAACGTPSGQPSPRPLQRPTPTPTPQPLVAVVEPGSPQDTLVLITLNGEPVAQTLISKSAVIAGTTATEVAYENQDMLQALQSDGQVVTLGSMQGFKGGRVVLSPNGKQWMWSTYDRQAGGQVHSFVYLDDRLVADDVLPGRFFEPVAWTARGVVFEQAQLGLGSDPFDLVSGPTTLLQPQDQSAGNPPRGTPLTPQSCLYGDLAQDGTVVCRTPGSGVTTTTALQFLPHGGTAFSVALPQPQFAEAGAVSYLPPTQQSSSPTPTEAVVGGAVTTQASPSGQGASYQTAIVNLQTRTLTPLPTAGLEPGAGSWTWLSATQLIAYRPAGATGGDPGIYIANTNGPATPLWPQGTPVGLLDQGGASGASPQPSPSGSANPASQV